LEVYLVPPQVHQFGRAEAMAIGQQDHGRVAVAVPIVFLDGRQHLIDFSLQEVLARPDFLIGPPARLGAGCRRD
jgi:hypothetical protein